MEFRARALEKLEAPEELDQPIRLTRPRAWLALVALTAVVATAAVWVYAGNLPNELNATGVLAFPRGGFRVESTVPGVVSQILVSPGNTVSAGTRVAKVAGADQSIGVVRAMAAGRITQVLARPGQTVTAGAPVAVAERAGDDDRLVGLLYLPAGDAARVRAGSVVDMAVQSAPTRTFGTVRGAVVSVGPRPQTREEIAGFLGDDGLAGQLAAGGPVMKVVVALATARTPSGLAWSTGDGPPYPLACRTRITASVHLPPVRPIDRMMPR